jgi:hypothetical protein
LKIESVVAGIAYEKDPCVPFQYSPEAIGELEGRIGRPFPDDFRWYLANVGWRRIDYDHRTILVRRGEYLHDLKFEGAENQVFSLGRYRDFLESREGDLLPHVRTFYIPFGELNGGNPSVSLRLLISLNDENCGSIFAVKKIGFSGDQNPSEPIRIADDVAAFLEQIGPDRKLRPMAERNNEELFTRLMDDYLNSAGHKPTAAAAPQTLIREFSRIRIGSFLMVRETSNTNTAPMRYGSRTNRSSRKWPTFSRRNWLPTAFTAHHH